ncbi:uncharacterized protein P174DRAFT_458726 [Aspergillus novofumigatus IBT 16806]|uniref:Uncharacterized protein n=1 Tax=Aspergillus novofumigatus (strain IBT 16806) TaxID=1392255 RepID=A0A2I1CC35_ASPN1|nr:uncharacterized protein P174DRAFT_458726 [Aspergillus novofumigatus IBT 16806]PKX95156.1 hypothetical protein P174DRAFT_458726 [Aspergillus novofumigatus IBT 16806]
MANFFRKLFLFRDSQIPPPTQINIAVTVSSSTLHKYSSDDEFHITIEATLPQTPNTPDKPLTILVFGTLLDPSGIALYENGFDFVNVDTGTPAKRPSLTKHYSFGGRYFVTLQPVITNENEAKVAAAFSQVTYLEVGSMYRVELGNKLNQISWYRYGSKEQVLEGQDAGAGLVKRRPELVGDSEMQPIPLVMQGSASFTVEE